jgi:hypothetical protein
MPSAQRNWHPLVLVVDSAHQGSSGRQDLVNEDEDRLLRSELDPFPDHIYELPNGEILRVKRSSK